MKARLHKKNAERGFTLTEMLIATVVVLVGLVAVAQLVPASIFMNSNNRNDATALIMAQRQMEIFRAVPLSQPSLSDPNGVLCPAGDVCELGDPTTPNQPVGSPVVLDSNGVPVIDFSQSTTVPGYSFTFKDPNDPYAADNDVRWAVITTVLTTTSGPTTIPTSRRIILGVYRKGMRSLILPVTLDVTVEK